MRFGLLALALCISNCFANTTVAATPRDELLRLVPNETAICFVVQGLRERARTVAGSPFATWVQEKYRPLLGNAPEIEKLQDLEKLFSTFVGVTLADLRDDIFGDAIVLAYRPGPVGKPDEEQGFVLVKARDGKKLAKLIDKLNSLQKSSGELSEIRELTHAGQRYYHRAKTAGPGEYYLLQGDLFAFAARESAIREVIDRSRIEKPEPSLVAKSLEELGVQNAFVLCWFNPRKLDAEVQAHASAVGNAKEKATRQQFARVWSAVDHFALYLDANKELELGMAVRYRAEALPPEFKSLLGTKPRSSALWQTIPDDALFAMAGRVSGPALVDAILSFSPIEERAAAKAELEKSIGAVIGKDKFGNLLNGIGPDCGFWATKTKNDSGLPDLTAAIRLNDAAVAPSVSKLLNFYTQSAQVEYNRNHDDQIESQTENGIAFFTNEKRFPKGFRPAYGIAEGFLVFGSSPERVQAFRKPTTPEGTGEETLFVRIDGAAVQSHLRQHGKQLASWLADRDNRPFEDVAKELETVAEAIRVLDRAEGFIRSNGSITQFAVRFKFVKPLAK